MVNWHKNARYTPKELENKINQFFKVNHPYQWMYSKLLLYLGINREAVRGWKVAKNKSAKDKFKLIQEVKEYLFNHWMTIVQEGDMNIDVRERMEEMKIVKGVGKNTQYQIPTPNINKISWMLQVEYKELYKKYFPEDEEETKVTVHLALPNEGNNKV